MYRFTFYPDKKLSKLQQIARSIIVDIEKGVLAKDACLPSINAFSAQYEVARDTIERAYKNLKSQGYITSVAGKGYFVRGKREKHLKILLIFNKLSSFKKSFYESFICALGDKAKVSLQVHHYNDLFLREILEKNLNLYDYYVVMPHFIKNTGKFDYFKILKKIPSSQLILLDKKLPGLSEGTITVYQDFKEDIYDALTSSNYLLRKYSRLVLIVPEDSHHFLEIVEGTTQYCKENNKEFSLRSASTNERLDVGTVYIITEENDLADIIKKVKKSQYNLGQDIGIISFNETALKELLDITTLSTDFEQMATCAADFILNRKVAQINTPLKMINRNSI